MTTHIIAVVDCSGSMGHLRHSAVEGYNAFLQQQAAVPGDAYITTLMFNNTVVTFGTSRPLALATRLNQLNYRTNGGTAMNDAIGYAVAVLGSTLELSCDQVICAILTDGEENASRIYSQDRVRELISRARARGWTFIFLAANIDAEGVGAAYGFAAETTYSFSYDSAGAREAFENMGRATVAARMCP